MDFSLTNETKRQAPRIPWKKVKDKILGSRYELSLVLCGNGLSQELNRVYRGKDQPTNVLAFEISKSSGEIFINLQKLAPFSALELFIHGLLHLKGMEHGDRMSEREKFFFSLFHGAHNSSRNRSGKFRS